MSQHGRRGAALAAAVQVNADGLRNIYYPNDTLSAINIRGQTVAGPAYPVNVYTILFPTTFGLIQNSIGASIISVSDFFAADPPHNKRKEERTPNHRWITPGRRMEFFLADAQSSRNRPDAGGEASKAKPARRRQTKQTCMRADWRLGSTPAHAFHERESCELCRDLSPLFSFS